jgi:DUF1680 family protein
VLDTNLSDGSPVRLVQKTDYPWDGKIVVTAEKSPDRDLALRLRVPGWVSGVAVRVNGQPVEADWRPGSYVTLKRRWSPGDRVELDLPMEVTMVESHPLVEETRNHAAILRGPPNTGAIS